MKRWLLFLLILSAAVFVRAEASSSESTHQRPQTALLSQSSPADFSPLESPLLATTLPRSETIRTGNTVPAPGNGPSVWLSSKGYLHPFIQNFLFHSLKICGHADHLRSSYPRPTDHFVYAFRKIVI